MQALGNITRSGYPGGHQQRSSVLMHIGKKHTWEQESDDIMFLQQAYLYGCCSMIRGGGGMRPPSGSLQCMGRRCP